MRPLFTYPSTPRNRTVGSVADTGAMTQNTAVTPARRIPMAGPLNFRDLGGYATSSGEAVRWRRAFRSDALDHMTDGDAELLATELGVRTVIDLRTTAETEQTTPPPT